MATWIIVIIIVFNVFGVVLRSIFKRIEKVNQRPNANSFFSIIKEKEVKKVDEVFKDIEDVWAKFD